MGGDILAYAKPRRIVLGERIEGVMREKIFFPFEDMPQLMHELTNMHNFFFGELSEKVELCFSTREADVFLVINLEGEERGVFFRVRNKKNDILSIVQITSVSMFVNLIVASRSLLLIAKEFDIHQILFLEKFTKRLLDWEREETFKLFALLSKGGKWLVLASQLFPREFGMTEEVQYCFY